MRITSYELRATARTLVKHAGFTIAAIVSLGLAIGLNTTMYSTLDALINPKVAWREPGQVYRVVFWGDRRALLRPQDRRAMLRNIPEVEALSGAWVGNPDMLLESPTSHRTGWVATVPPNYFQFLGVRPLRGRLLSEIDVGASTPAVLLSERAARDLVPRSRDPVGERIQLNGVTHIVAGVLARDAEPPTSRILAWRLPADGVDLDAPQMTFIRLRSGMTHAAMLPKLAAVAGLIAAQTNELSRDNRVELVPMKAEQRHFGVFQYAVVSAVIAVLLVACANIANLQLARGIARGRELATRAALGASRRDLVTHLMLESAMIAVAGLVLGLILTFWGMAAIRASIPPDIGEFFVEPQTSWRLFVVAAIVTALTVLLIGLVPAIRVSRVDLNALIKSGAGTGSTRTARRQYGLLIVAEIGFALVVLCAAALLVRASVRLENDAESWDRSNVTTASVSLRLSPGQSIPFAQVAADLTGKLRATPGLDEVAMIRSGTDADKVVTATDPGGAMHTVPAPQWAPRIVSSSYVRAMGYKISHGRDFRDGEVGAFAIVDAPTARLLWPNTEALGHMIKFGAPNTPGRWYTVVGIRAPVGRESSSDRSTSPGAVYISPTADDSIARRAAANLHEFPNVTVFVRASQNPHRAPVAVKNALANDPRYIIWRAVTMDEQDGSATRRVNQRFVSQLFALFAVVAFGLAALGVYGIVSHSVAERRRELGVRLALGSSARGILYVVMREGNVFVMAGIAVGLFLIHRYAWMLTQFVGSFPEIDLHAIELFLPAAAFFFAAAVMSAFIPAWRATRIDPVESLRCE